MIVRATVAIPIVTVPVGAATIIAAAVRTTIIAATIIAAAAIRTTTAVIVRATVAIISLTITISVAATLVIRRSRHIGIKVRNLLLHAVRLVLRVVRIMELLFASCILERLSIFTNTTLGVGKRTLTELVDSLDGLALAGAESYSSGAQAVGNLSLLFALSLQRGEVVDVLMER